MVSVASILEEVKENGYWDSNTDFHCISEHDSSVIVECLKSHENLYLGISRKGEYFLEIMYEDVKPLTRGDLKTLLSGSVRDCSSFAHLVGEVSDIRLLRKLPVRFSLDLYSVNTELQRAVDTIMSLTSFLYGTCIGLCIRKNDFVLLKTEKVEDMEGWGYNYKY